MNGSPPTPRLSLFGPTLVVGPDNRSFAPGGVAARRVLAHLALFQPTPVSGVDLLAHGWASSDLTAPHATLRMTVSRLRRAVAAGGQDSIDRTPEGYRLAGGVRSDVRDFVHGVTLARSSSLEGTDAIGHLADVLALWRGLPYADGESDVFLAEQQRLAELRFEAVSRLVEAALSAGDIGPAQDHLQAVLADRPLHDGLVALRMRVSYASGDQRGALRAFDEHRTRLAEESGLEPTPELRSLQVRVLHQQLPVIRPKPLARSPGLGWIVGTVVGSPAPASAARGTPELGAMDRAEVSAALGHWEEAAMWFLRSVDGATQRGDEQAAVDYCLRLAHVVWDPRLGAVAAQYLEHLLDRAASPVVAARIRLCLAGGLFRTGYESVAVDSTQLRDAVDVLTRKGDRQALGWGLTHYRDALSGSLAPADALRLTNEVASLGLDDQLLRGQTMRAMFASQLRLDRRAAAAAIVRSIVADGSTSAANRFGRVVARNCWDLAIGRWGRAEDGLADLLDFKGRLGERAVDEVLMAQSFWLCRERGEPQAIAAHREGALHLASIDPGVPHWRVVAAILAMDAGAPEEAVAELTEVDREFFLADPDVGSHRLAILALTAEVLASGDAVGSSIERSLAKRVLDALVADPNRAVLLGWPTVFVGSKDRFIALAAHAAGQPDLARRAADAAVRADRWMPALLRRSLLARGIVAPERAGIDRRRASSIHRSLVGRLENG